MEEIKKIEEEIGFTIPERYSEFLRNYSEGDLEYKNFSRILSNGTKKIIQIERVMNKENFIHNNVNLDYIQELQEDDELPASFVESEFLYHIMNCDSKSVLISLNGQHKGKIYVVDYDYGITFQSENLEIFLSSIFDLREMKCSIEDISDSIRKNDLENLKILLEQDGGILIYKNSTYHNNYFVELAKELNMHKIEDYLTSLNL